VDLNKFANNFEKKFQISNRLPKSFEKKQNKTKPKEKNPKKQIHSIPSTLSLDNIFLK
jgi:hypothetical protein